MTISIDMCTYKGGRFLDEQLQSIGRQTPLPDELVICSNGSSDDTNSIIERFVASFGFPVRVIYNSTNLGCTANFAQAIRLCGVDLIALCDRDDIWMESKLAGLKATFSDRSIGGVFSDGTLIDEDSSALTGTLWSTFGSLPPLRENWLKEDALQILMRQDIITGATLMFRADLRSVVLPISHEWVHDGWRSWIIAMTSRLNFVDEPLIRYRVHASQQAGVPNITWRARFARLLIARTGRSQEVRKFQELYHRLNSISLDSVMARRMPRKKIERCRFRAALPYRRASRFPVVLAHLADYSQYSRGFTDAFKDVLQQ